MKKFADLILFVFSVVALSWVVPWFVGLCFPKTGGEPFAAFSPVSGQWILSEISEGKKQSIYSIGPSAEVSAVYTENQRDSLLPQIYYKDLLAREQLPDSIAGRAVNVPALKHGEMTFTSSPRDINRRSPGVFPMMESMPRRADLEDPVEVFRMNGKMEFVDMATNRVNHDRSDRFNEVLLQRGFSFPMKDCHANVTSRKLRDEGYLMADNKGKVFHVKQRGGRPYVAKVNFPDTVCVKKVFVFENMDDSLVGMAVDCLDNIYFILRDGYRTVRLPIGKVDPAKERINVMGNMFNIVFRVASDDETRWIALDRDSFGLLGQYDYRHGKSDARIVKSYILPYQLDFNSSKDSFVYPRVSNWSWHAIYLNIVLSVILIFRVRRRRRNTDPIMPVLTLFFGIYLFIPALLIR